MHVGMAAMQGRWSLRGLGWLAAAFMAGACAGGPPAACVPLPDGACIATRAVAAQGALVFDPTGEWQYDDLYYGEWLFELRLIGDMTLQGMKTLWRHTGGNIWLAENGSVLLINGPDMGYIWLDDGHGAEGPVFRR